MIGREAIIHPSGCWTLMSVILRGACWPDRRISTALSRPHIRYLLHGGRSCDPTSPSFSRDIRTIGDRSSGHRSPGQGSQRWQREHPVPADRVREWLTSTDGFAHSGPLIYAEPIPDRDANIIPNRHSQPHALQHSGRRQSELRERNRAVDAVGDGHPRLGYRV